MWPVATDQVASSVCLSVCLLVFHTGKPCKVAEVSKMPFGLRTQVGPGDHVLDGGPHPPWEGAVLRGGRGVPL